MRKISSLACALSIVALHSCKESPTEYATKWTADLKQKIKKESGQTPDSTVIDSTKRIITHLKNGLKLEQIYFADRERTDTALNAPVKYDTVKYVYFSTGQDYQLVIDPCVNRVFRSYETIAYKNNSFGQIEYIECGTKIKEVGFHVNNDNVGPWTKYDSTGKKITTVETGNEDKLEILKSMKY